MFTFSNKQMVCASYNHLYAHTLRLIHTRIHPLSSTGVSPCIDKPVHESEWATKGYLIHPQSDWVW